MQRLSGGILTWSALLVCGLILSSLSVYAEEATAGTAIVTNTGGQGANLRAQPTSSAPVLRVVADGELLSTIGDGQTDSSGRIWRNVQDQSGAVGWVAAEYLPSPQPQLPAPAPQARALVDTPGENCTDTARRFPETVDPDGALAQAIVEVARARRINIYGANPLLPARLDAYRMQAEELVSGWVGVSLLRAEQGRPAIAFHEYVNRGFPYQAVGRNALGYYITPTMSGAEWQTLRSLPPTTCAGAFMADPRNARIVRLMSANVGDGGWSALGD